MLTLNRFARQLELMGRVPKHRKRRRPVPPARQPSAPRIAYLRGLLQMVGEVHAHLRRDLLPAVRPIIEAHNALRPDAMELRLDATGSRTAAEMKRIRKELERVIPERRISLLAEQNALRVAEHSRKELNRQVRTVANIDVYADPTVLAEHVEAFVEDNVRLVKGLMSRELDDLEGIVLRGARAGLRYEEIADDIVEKFGVTKRRAALIARDQVTTLNAELTRIRQQQVGIEQYTWSTVKDERVRKSHRALEGTTQRWDSPPTVDGEKAHPGQPINCRCQAIPDVDAALREAGLLGPETETPSAPTKRSTPPRSAPPGRRLSVVPTEPASRTPASSRRPAPTAPAEPAPPAAAELAPAWMTEPITVLSEKPAGDGVNAPSRLTVRTHSGKTTQAFWKAASKEKRGARRGVRGGTYYQREVAAYELDQELGPGGVVPPTVAREIDGGVGAFQDWVHGTETHLIHGALEAAGASLAAEPSTRRMFLLDLIMANDDRHGGNAMWRRTRAGRWEVKAIDQGFAFPAGKPMRFFFAVNEDGFQSALMDLDERSVAQLRGLQLDRIAAILHRQPGITSRQIRETLARIRSLQNDPGQIGRLPEKGFRRERIHRWLSRTPEERGLSAEELAEIDQLAAKP